MPTLIPLIVASAGLGALIGLIRQWSDQVSRTDGGIDFGGVRTHTFWAVLGCLAAVAGRDFSPLVLPVVIAAVAVYLIAMRVAAGRAPEAPGGTSFAASLLTLFTGCLVAWGHTQSAVVVAALTMVTLGTKQPIHALTRHFTAQDIRCALQFVAVTGVILPLVPDRAMGPYEAFNPYSTWMMVVLISGIGFAGYGLMRLLGARAGLTAMSLLGGLSSSTATTLAFSRSSRENERLSSTYAFAVAMACAVMLPRVFVAVFVLNPLLAARLALPLGLMALPAAAYGLWFWRQTRRQPADVGSPALANPLGLFTAVKFALLYAVIAFLVHVVTQTGLHTGLLPLSFISGLTDMDAISLSMANNARAGRVDLALAADAVVVGAIANSLLKAVLAAALGSRLMRRHMAVVLGATALVGALAAVVW